MKPVARVNKIDASANIFVFIARERAVIRACGFGKKSYVPRFLSLFGFACVANLCYARPKIAITRNHRQYQKVESNGCSKE